MAVSKIHAFTVALGLLASCMGRARAQDYCCDPLDVAGHDLRWFEPVELDLGCELERKVGYFFGYERLYWAISGERTEVGDPTVLKRANPVWGGTPLDPVTGLPIERPILANSIHSAVPRANFAWGHRYEFGYNGEERGFIMTVLDGPEQNQTALFGLNGGSLEQTLPAGLQSPLGDVVVNFRTTPGFMAGFLDVRDETTPGAVLIIDRNGDGIADGDGWADDLDEDGQHGPQGFDTEPPLWEPDARIIGELPDYDDLVDLPTAFRTLVLQNSTEIDGVEIMRSHRLDNRHMMASKQNNTFEIFYGVRYLRLNDRFLAVGEGGVMGLSFWDTRIINNIVGPQFGFRMNSQHGRWAFTTHGRFTAGYNISNWAQDGAVGEEWVPGQLNRPLYAQPHSFSYGRTDSDFSPVGELRIESSYNITTAVALKVGWTGTFVGGIRRAGNHIDYVLPNMGFRDGDREELFVNGVTFGAELNH